MGVKARTGYTLPAKGGVGDDRRRCPGGRSRKRVVILASKDQSIKGPILPNVVGLHGE